MGNRVIALGFFDGVHLGHAALLTKTIERARALGAASAALSFSVHPSEVVQGEGVGLICSARERCRLMREDFGIQDVILWEFDAHLMRLEPREFLRRVKEELCAVHLVAGYDYRFGHRGAGDAQELVRLAAELGMGADIVRPVPMDGEAVSSTRIRALIAAGDIPSAERLLGHPYSISGVVEHGDRLGRTIGLPTANLSLERGVLLPKFGVYAARVQIGDEVLHGITNIGVRPTVSDEKVPRAETHIPNFSRDLYGREIRVELVRFIRGEMKFAALDALKAQIERDVAELGR